MILRPVSPASAVAEVFHPPDLALEISKLSHCQIEIAVAVQVFRLNVRHPGDLIQENPLSEPFRSQVFQHDNGADLFVVGHDHSHARNEQVQIAVPVDVTRLNMSRPSDIPIEIRLHENARGLLANPTHRVGPPIAYNHVHEPILIQVHNYQVGN